MVRQVDPQHPPPAPSVSPSAGQVRAASGLWSFRSHGGQHDGGDPGHLPPGGPGDPLPDPDQRAPTERHPSGLQTGPEQTEPEILLQV